MHPIAPLPYTRSRGARSRRSGSSSALLRTLRAILFLAAPLLALGLLLPDVAMAHPTLGVGFQAAPQGEARYYGQGYNRTHALVPGYGGTLHIDVDVSTNISLGASFEATGWQTGTNYDAGYDPNVMLDFFFVPRLRIPVEEGRFHSSLYLAAPIGPSVDVPDRRAAQFPISSGTRSPGLGVALGARAGFQFFYGRVGAFTDVGVTGHFMTYSLDGVLGSSRVDSEMVWWSARVGLIVNLEDEIRGHEHR